MAQVFDETYYLAENPDVAAAVRAGIFTSGYSHFIQHGDAEGRNPNTTFDNSYYLAHNPDVAAAVSSHIFASGYDHFLTHGQYEGRAPSSSFDEKAYLAANTDVAAAVSNHTFTSGWEHYTLYGQAEGRSSGATSPVDASWYSAAYSDVKDANINPLYHYLHYGQFEGRLPTSPAALSGNDNLTVTDLHTINGGAGNDTLSGSASNDTLYGETGNDLLFGNAGVDIIHGGSGDDTLTGSNYVYGIRASIVGGADADTLYGGDGNDVIVLQATPQSFASGGSGNDIFLIQLPGKTYGTIQDFAHGEDKITFFFQATPTVSYEGHQTIVTATASDGAGGSVITKVILSGHITLTDTDFAYGFSPS